MKKKGIRGKNGGKEEGGFWFHPGGEAVAGRTFSNAIRKVGKKVREGRLRRGVFPKSQGRTRVGNPW